MEQELGLRRIKASSISDRRGLIDHLAQSLSDQYRVQIEQDEVRQTSTYIKTYILESHITRVRDFADRIGGILSTPRWLSDETILHLSDKNDVDYFFDFQDSRFVKIYTIGEARYSDLVFDRLTDGRINGLDRAWLPASFLLASKRGQLTGFKFWHQSRAAGVGHSSSASKPSVSSATHEEGIAETEALPRFRLEVTGQANAEADLAELKASSVLEGRKAVQEVSFRESDGDGGLISTSVYANGKIVGKGTSVSLYMDITASTARRYADLIREIEDTHALGWRSSSGRSVLSGTPFLIRFPEGLQIFDLQAFVDSIFRVTKPFRLFAIHSYSGNGRIDLEALDLHTGHPIAVEVTPEWMRIYLPSGTCGNVLARLFCNLQYALHSDISLETGASASIF